MESLYIDWKIEHPCNYAEFYVEDRQNFRIKKSSRFLGNAYDIAGKAVDIVLNNYPKIKEIKIDTSAFGLSIAENVESELKRKELKDVRVLRYRMISL